MSTQDTETAMRHNAKVAIGLSLLGIFFMGAVLNTVALVTASRIYNRTEDADTLRLAQVALWSSCIQLAVLVVLFIVELVQLNG